ncbi:PP2C family protein-serine/threonine phosphatase [Streptomyces sp. NPDC089919]|uniref:PP2C family protein-serine/threonine phosphatase n=1 Tax=Streptomyces sp. NPDC089919 TaxID=3155188 RepID=UPI00341271BA
MTAEEDATGRTAGDPAAGPGPVVAVLREAVMPLGLMALIAGLDLATGRDTYFYPFLVLGPALAATVARPAVVLGVGLLALPLRYLLAFYDHVGTTAPADKAFQYNTFGVAAAVGASVVVSWLRLKRERKLAVVTEVALAAQRAILLPPPDTVDGIRIAVRYYPVAEHAELGGDLYDARATEHGVRVVIGDVAGKGLDAVRTAAITLGAFREAVHEEPDLAGVARRVERGIVRDAPADAFVTALFLEFGPDGVEFLHRGHEPPVLVTADGAARELEPPEPGLPLGLAALDRGAAAAAPRWSVPFPEGDLLLLVTDGVTDATDRTGRQYRLPRRAAELLARGTLPADPRTVVDLVGRDLLAHVRGHRLTDDTLVVALARIPGHPLRDTASG